MPRNFCDVQDRLGPLTKTEERAAELGFEAGELSVEFQSQSPLIETRTLGERARASWGFMVEEMGFDGSDEDQRCAYVMAWRLGREVVLESA